MKAGVLFVLAVALIGALSGQSAFAATPPTLIVQVIGQGTVTGTGINCGLGNLTCYATYGGSSQGVTLTPTAASGWTFDHWADTCPGTCSLGGVNPTTATATAVFTSSGTTIPTQTFGVSLTTQHGTVSNGSSGYQINCGSGTGATTCSLTVLQGSTITVAETPDASYLFSRWGGACSGTGASCSAYLNTNQSVTADFISATSNVLTVTVTGFGSVKGGGIDCGAGATCTAPEPPNSSVTLSEAPASGYAFTGWGGGCTGMQTTCTVEMSAARTVTATFAQQVQLSVTVSGNGTVTGGGISCGPGPQTCTNAETPDTNVTLAAAPGTGGTVFWSGCTTASGTTCTVSIGTTPIAVTATFSGGTVPTYSLAVSVTGDGYVVSSAGAASVYCTSADGSSCNSSATGNTSVTLTAITASGSIADFSGWTGDCSTFTGTTCTLTMNGSKTVGARFAGPSTTYLLTGQVTGTGTITGGGLNCSSGGSSCSAQQAAGASITLTATATAGATFSGWNGACTGTVTTCTVSMTSARSVTATFAPRSAETLRITVTGQGTISATNGVCNGSAGKSVTCTQEYVSGAQASLTATPASGMHFVGWSGACAGTTPICTVSITAAKAVGALFIGSELAANGKPVVQKTAHGYRVTVPYAAAETGQFTLVATRSGHKAASLTKTAAVGTGTVSLIVKSRGRYVFTLTLTASDGKHAVHWTVVVR